MTSILNRESREPAQLVVYDGCVLRITRNFPNVPQGSLCVVNFNESSVNSLSAYCAPSPSDVTESNIESEVYRTWTHLRIRKLPGFIVNHANCLIRRTQFPVCNYIALTIHKLMGDTFESLATSISVVEKKYSLWLTSQLYVILSRVQHLRQLIFVGNVETTLAAIEQLLLRKNLQEIYLYQFFRSVQARESGSSRLVEMPSTVFMNHHFDVPVTKNGFVYVLVSLKDQTLRTMLVDSCSGSLASTLRWYNSTSPGQWVFSFGVSAITQREPGVSKLLRMSCMQRA